MRCWQRNFQTTSEDNTVCNIQCSRSSMIRKCYLFCAVERIVLRVCVKRSNKISVSKQPSVTGRSRRRTEPADTITSTSATSSSITSATSSSSSSTSSSGRHELVNGLTVCEICGAVVKCLSMSYLLNSLPKIMLFFLQGIL